MQFKRDALLLRYADYKESDRMVTLLTAEGKISAAMKGVRKGSAKLAFAAQPFCFGEYVFTQTAGRNTVISASIYDGFYPLREEIFRFYAAAVVTEVCDKLVYEDTESGAFLVLAVQTLEALCGVQGNAAGGLLVVFLLKALALAGYAVRADVCPVCGKTPRGIVRFDMESGTFCCFDCAKCVRASESTFLAIRSALHSQTPDDPDGIARALKLLGVYFETRTETPLSSLKEFSALAFPA